MAIASGKSDIHSGTDVGKWGVKGKIFLGLPKGEFFSTPCVYAQSAQTFVENSNVGEQHEKTFDPLTPPPSRPLAAGPSICHLSPVTRGGGGGTMKTPAAWVLCRCCALPRGCCTGAMLVLCPCCAAAIPPGSTSTFPGGRGARPSGPAGGRRP